jgi:hypothetical protein
MENVLLVVAEVYRLQQPEPSCSLAFRLTSRTFCDCSWRALGAYLGETVRKAARTVTFSPPEFKEALERWWAELSEDNEDQVDQK